MESASETADLVTAMVRFCRLLRERGIKLASDASQIALRAWAEIDISQLDDCRNALMIALLQRPEDRPAFIYLFNAFWVKTSQDRRAPVADPFPGHPADRQSDGHQPGLTDESGGLGTLRSAGQSPRDSGPDDEDKALASVASSVGLAGSFGSSFTYTQQHELDRLSRALTQLLATRKSRRRVSDQTGNLPDLRATMRSSLRHGGTPIEFERATRRITRTRLVVFCDVSRSMDEYVAFFLEFAAAVLRRPWKMEVFLFATELARITRIWPHRSFADLKASLPDCGGGTQIGRSLDSFLNLYGDALLGSGTIVIILSDGLDAGDPALVESAMDRLRHRCHAVIWLNPLMHLKGYEPRAAGMAAALKYVDVFAPMHDLASMRDLVGLIRDLTRSGRGELRSRMGQARVSDGANSRSSGNDINKAAVSSQ
ncbi:MAG TPA: VWA domain-containing protein [Candidatus Binataceae bacterium]|nr:VWA domain-containing protein [Candidatus Binataceae bacterium]